MAFSNPSTKVVFVICFTLAFESTSFKRKIIKYFVSDFYQIFYMAKSLFSFRDFSNILKISLKTTAILTCLNALRCSHTIIHICMCNVV